MPNSIALSGVEDELGSKGRQRALEGGGEEGEKTREEVLARTGQEQLQMIRIVYMTNSWLLLDFFSLSLGGGEEKYASGQDHIRR